MAHLQDEIKVFNLFLKHHKIFRNDYELKKSLIGNDSFLTLSSLVDFFRLEKIKFSIFQFVKTEDLLSIFLTYLNINNKIFLSFVKKRGDFFLAYIGQEKINFSATEINELMTDYIIVVEQESSFNYYFNAIIYYLEENTIFFSLYYIVLVSMIQTEGSNLIVTLLALIGGVTSLIFIIKKGGSLTLQNICTSNQVDTCKKIQDIKLLNALDTSFLSISYFVTLLIFVRIPSSNLYSDLYFFSILSLSAVFFSVLYQIFKIRSICLLCSIINITLIILFFYLLEVSGNHASFNVIFLFILIGVYSILHIVYSMKQLKKEVLNLRRYLNSFQSNLDIFSFYLEESRSIVSSNLDFSIGSSIILIINPDCNSCKDLLKEFKNVIIENILDVEIKYNLFYDSSDKEYTKASILLKLYHENKTLFFKYIEGDNSVDTFFKITENEQRKIDQILQNDINWCKLNQILGVPGVVINNVLFPIHKYEFNYLRLLIEDYFEEDY